MSLALTVSRGRVSPCFSGVHLWVLPADGVLRKAEIVPTIGWGPPHWGQELMRRDVTTLLCAGIDRFLWGALQGYGVQVVPEAVGAPGRVVELWQRGDLAVPAEWPVQTVCGCGRRTRARMRRGRRGHAGAKGKGSGE